MREAVHGHFTYIVVVMNLFQIEFVTFPPISVKIGLIESNSK